MITLSSKKRINSVFTYCDGESLVVQNYWNELNYEWRLTNHGLIVIKIMQMLCRIIHLQFLQKKLSV